MVNEINEDKCRMLHLGNRNNNFNYSLNGKQLESIKVERDLRILVDDKLKFMSNVIRQRIMQMQF